MTVKHVQKYFVGQDVSNEKWTYKLTDGHTSMVNQGSHPLYLRMYNDVPVHSSSCDVPYLRPVSVLPELVRQTGRFRMATLHFLGPLSRVACIIVECNLLFRSQAAHAHHGPESDTIVAARYRAVLPRSTPPP